MNVAAIPASINVRARAAIGFCAGAPLEPILTAVTRNRAAIRKCERLLQRHIDALPGTGDTTMTQPGEAQHRCHGARHLISEMARRRALPLGVVALAVEKSPRGIGDGVTALIAAVGPGATKWCNSDHHQAGEFGFEEVVVEAELFQIE